MKTEKYDSLSTLHLKDTWLRTTDLQSLKKLSLQLQETDPDQSLEWDLNPMA